MSDGQASCTSRLVQVSCTSFLTVCHHYKCCFWVWYVLFSSSVSFCACYLQFHSLIAQFWRSALIIRCRCIMLPGIRTALMESPDHTCPNCETPGQSPDVLIPNKYLRAMVTSFVNETSYVSARKPTASMTTPSSSASGEVKPVAVKAEPLRADAGSRSTAQLMGAPPHVSFIMFLY